MDIGITAGVGPDHGRNRSDGQFHPHAGRSDNRPLPFILKRPGRGCIHIRHGRKDQQHNPHDVHLAAAVALPIALAGDGMAEFVAGLDECKTQIEQGQIAGIQDVAGPRGD